MGTLGIAVELIPNSHDENGNGIFSFNKNRSFSENRGKLVTVFIIGALSFLIILVIYSVVSFEVGHWFRGKLWIFYEIALIALGVHGIVFLDPLVVILTALPFLSHLRWMKMSRRYGPKPY